MSSDSALLHRYATSRDAEAFAEIARRHAGLVYATCLRTLGNAADAEDVAQECFLELLRNAARVRSSLPGYLHTLARNRSLDARRSSARRLRREQQHVSAATPDPTQITWEQLAPHVDAAIARLHDNLRTPLLMHYFENQTQSAIAQQLAIDQATISRRLAKAIERLREYLGDAGVVAPAALPALLAKHAILPAPESLVSSLTKLSLAGPKPLPPHSARLSPLVKTAAGAVIAVGIVCVGIALKHPKESTMNAPTAAPAATLLLADVPPGHEGNREVVGVETILHYLTPAARTSLPYHRLMGLSGMAFITQAQDDIVFGGMLDVGWWPMDSWGFYFCGRLDFLSRAIGWRLRHVPEVESEFRADPAAFYTQHFGPEVQASLAAGKPVLSRHDMAFLIVGSDSPQQPPIGRTACEPTPDVRPLQGDPEYPWGLLIFDHPIEMLDASLADREALRYAVAIANDQVPTPSPHFSTGQKSYRAWSAFLRDHAGATQVRHHNNMLLHLRLNRIAAIAFCRDLAAKYPGAAGGHLAAAADLYRQLWDAAGSAKTANVDASAAARDQLADVVDRLAALDARAADELRLAYLALTLAYDDNGFERDSFSLAMCAAARHFGLPADYTTVAALSSNIAAPSICTSETCTAWWQFYNNDTQLDLAISTLGLQASKLPLVPFTGNSADIANFQRQYRERIPQIRQALVQGQLVALQSGWQPWIDAQKTQLNPWCFWGFVTDCPAAPDDLPIRGASLNGRQDNPHRVP